MQNNIDHGSAAAGLQALPDGVERQILAAVTGIQYGSVVIAIQDGRVVQIEATEKHRIAR
ncbi:MAG: putative small protein [Betaproteobacteria bacterium]|jgi:hypothetical protein|nr:putative small protein [Betaproteobacteria bacterium]